MKYLSLLFLVVCVNACTPKKVETMDVPVPQQYDIKDFLDQVAMLEDNNLCSRNYHSDSYEYELNENIIFRCSNNSSSVYIELEALNSEPYKVYKATLMWKEWNRKFNSKMYQVNAQRMAAIFTSLYPVQKSTEFIEKFFYGEEKYVFINNQYDIEISVEKKNLYNVRVATVRFK